jgi:acetolactate synthase-1/2/3 large subunit
MKQRVADFIAAYLVEKGVTNVFSVVGGGAMHLNNAFAINKGLKCVYQHHEQACAIAAESYARITNRLAVVCVTSGPGGTNALTGVLCAWQDNQPLLVISGQVRSDITVDSTGLNLRQFGEQEYYIVRSAAPMTKYAEMVTNANDIKYHLDKALYLATSGRRGPCWIDVPLDIQGCNIETDSLREYIPESAPRRIDDAVTTILTELSNAERPVILAGSAIRSADCLGEFYELADNLKLPILCPTSVVDIMANDDPYYMGMFGVFGGRAGNFIIQNADTIVALGCRMSFKQIGFNFENFATNARNIIVVDIDADELKKPTLHINHPICADLKAVIQELNARRLVNMLKKPAWMTYCHYVKNKFTSEYQKEREQEAISAYNFATILNSRLSASAIVVLGNNCAAVSMLQVGVTRRGQRLYGNVNCGTMGYDIPAAIGAAVAAQRMVICATGDGSAQMNLQELQTIAHHQLPIKIVIFNNLSYQAIVNTQTNFFNGVLAGCTKDSGVSFPEFEKIAVAYDFAYRKIEYNREIDDAVDWLLKDSSPAILELLQTAPDPIKPKLSSKRLPNGNMISASLDDLAPFLSRTEYDACQYNNWVSQ